MPNTLPSTSTIGLFGTCGGSHWRDNFMSLYQELGIPFFNPQVDDWTPDLAEVEAWHLANDSLILFPITHETYAAGSLAETGFSIQSALSSHKNRFVVIYIDPTISDVLKESNPESAKDSVRSRKLVLAHLKELNNPNVFVVTSLDEMRKKSLELFVAMDFIKRARNSPDVVDEKTLTSIVTAISEENLKRQKKVEVETFSIPPFS